jgi:hypothetical protein
MQRPLEKMERERGSGSLSHQPHPLVLHLQFSKWKESSLIADCWIQEKPCRVTVDTGSVTIARPDIVAMLPERELSRPYFLQTASDETIPVVKEARVELNIARCTLGS